eukprot:scaffold3159_cov393-Prasinococcus_capsulatus_cf.AAC.17
MVDSGVSFGVADLLLGCPPCIPRPETVVYLICLLCLRRHPKAVAPWEVPGKCSNVNFAFRRVASLIYAQRSQEHQGYPGHGDQHVVDDTVFENFTGTSCDADSVFHPQYFEWLGYKFVALRHEQHQHPRNHTSMIDKNYHRNGSGPLGDKEGPEQSCRHRKQNLPPLRGPHAVIFQAPIFYNFHLHRAIFFVSYMRLFWLKISGMGHLAVENAGTHVCAVAFRHRVAAV